MPVFDFLGRCGSEPDTDYEQTGSMWVGVCRRRWLGMHVDVCWRGWMRMDVDECRNVGGCWRMYADG